MPAAGRRSCLPGRRLAAELPDGRSERVRRGALQAPSSGVGASHDSKSL